MSVQRRRILGKIQASPARENSAGMKEMLPARARIGPAEAQAAEIPEARNACQQSLASPANSSARNASPRIRLAGIIEKKQSDRGEIQRFPARPRTESQWSRAAAEWAEHRFGYTPARNNPALAITPIEKAAAKHIPAIALDIACNNSPARTHRQENLNPHASHD